MCCQGVNKGSSRKGDQREAESIEASTPVFLQYPIPYTLDAPTPMLVAQSSTELHFGNPYSTSDPQGQYPPNPFSKFSEEWDCRHRLEPF